MKRELLDDSVKAKGQQRDKVDSTLEDDFEGDIDELIEKEESFPGARKINYDDEEFSDGESQYRLDDTDIGFDSYDDYEKDPDEMDDDDYEEFDDDYEDY